MFLLLFPRNILLCIWSLWKRASIWGMCIVENSLQFQCTSDWKFNEIYNKFTFPPLISFQDFSSPSFSSIIEKNMVHRKCHIFLSPITRRAIRFFSLLTLDIWNFMTIFYESFICLKCQLTLYSVCFVIFLRTSFQTFSSSLV